MTLHRIITPHHKMNNNNKKLSTFSVIHRRHFGETGYVTRMLTWMLTIRNRAHDYDALPRHLKMR